MTDPAILSAIRELAKRGLLSRSSSAVRLSPGNVDRQESPPRSSWLVDLPDGRKARLVLGPSLAELFNRQSKFAVACPALVAPPVFHAVLASGEAFADEYFDGVTLESLAERSPDLARAAFSRAQSALDATVRPSTDAARNREWREWSAAVEQLALWSTAERRCLREMVWPGLFPLLAGEKSVTRWSNGDFTAANILVATNGTTRLIDCEFAAETHFFREDAARIRALSPITRKQADLLSPASPPPAPAWHLFFWLRQLTMEAGHNSVAYLSRVRFQRLALIRLLGEFLLQRTLDGWSVAPTEMHTTLESARWEQTPSSALYVSGWCHVPRASIHQFVATQGPHQLAAAAPLSRPDVEAHFSGEPLARASGYALPLATSDPSSPIVISAVTNEGAWLPLHTLVPSALPGRGPWQEDFAAWCRDFDPDPVAPAEQSSSRLFSILLPVHDSPAPFLTACIDSVLQQHYPHWQLCIVDDASKSASCRELLDRYTAREPRIVLQRREANGGIATATNDALAMAQGEFVVMLDHDDMLRPHALAEFARRLDLAPDLDALYSDEDKIDAEGLRVLPFLKPAFSPEFLLGVMYIGHALCVRTALARQIGGFSPHFDGVQDYEFFLRVTEHTRRIGHIPRMLYHWRQSAGSSALHGDIKGDMGAKQADAVAAHLRRIRRIDQVIRSGPHRLNLRASRSPSVEVVCLEADHSLITNVRAAGARSQAQVLIFLTCQHAGMDETGAQLIADVALLSDSAIVTPLLLYGDGRVRESGWTIGPEGAAPVMRGFAPDRDGYNGSLVCTREVGAVSWHCFAVARDWVVSAPFLAAQGASWPDAVRIWGAQGRYHRTVPAAKLKISDRSVDPFTISDRSPVPDPFYNSQFDGLRGDYALARPPRRGSATD